MKYGPRGLGEPMAKRTMCPIVYPYCFGANYLMNLIRGDCDRATIEAMHLYSPDGFVRKIHFAVLRHLSRPD